MSLFAGNVSHRATADDVRNFFSRFGPCRVDVKRGYAFIDYDNDRDAEDARNDTNGRDFHGMKLNVEWSKKHIARTGGATGPASEWERRRSRYADDRRNNRDSDWDHNRDYRRRPDYDRHDRERDRDYDRRGRDLDRPYDRDRDDAGRYDRGRDRDRYNPRDYYGRDDRYDRPREGRGRNRERSRERGQEPRRYSAENDREDARNGGDDRPSDIRENDAQVRGGDDREKRSPGESADAGKRENNDLRDRDANGNGQSHADSEFDRSRDDDNYRRRPRDEDDPRDGDEEGELGSDRKRMRRDVDEDERGRRGRDYDEPDNRDGSRRISGPPYSSNPRDDESIDRRGEDNGENRPRDEDWEEGREPMTRSPNAGSPPKADRDDDYSRPTEDIRSGE